jgi:CrcB protein
MRVLALGLLGGYTTFSTWMLESERLAGERRTPVGMTNIVASLLVGLLAVWLGRELGGG